MFLDSTNEFYDLLAEVEVGTMPDTPPPEQLRDRAENEFSFVSFGAYVRLATRKRPTAPAALLDAIINAADFADLQDRVSSTLNIKPACLDFLAKIRPLMDPVEKFRNAVAHNRRVTQIVHGNYVIARDQLVEAIDAFLAHLD